MLLEIRLTLCGAMFIISAYFDLKRREVDDKLWWIFGALGLALIPTELFLGYSPNLPLYFTSAALAGGVGYALYYLGFYGGADAKALLVCALLAPLFHRNLILHPFTPFIVLVNSAILTVALAIYYGIGNLTRILRGEKIFEGLEHEPLHRKAFACLLGFRAKGRTGPFYFQMEKEEEGKRRFDFSLLRAYEEFTTKEGVWVTPGVPLLAFMAAGFVVTVVFGDLLAYILETILSLVKLVA